MIRTILTDIEGTTSSIAFVKEVLFPFAQAALRDFLAANHARPEVRAILDEVRSLAPGQDPAAALEGWLAADAKVTPLKSLQGLIWEAGYKDGRLKGHLWPDVAACLRAWHAGGLQLAVFSSGSVPAQKLLFGHSAEGDLTPLFDSFFDTHVGPKREAQSYQAIALAMRRAASEFLFLSDVAEELDAAAKAGMQVCQLIRWADGTQGSGRHPEAPDFPAVAARFGLPGG